MLKSFLAYVSFFGKCLIVCLIIFALVILIAMHLQAEMGT